MSILNKSQNQFITEFDLLTFPDLLRIAWFILCYPFDVLVLTARVHREERLGSLIVAELLNTIGQVTFYAFIRYIVGQRLGEEVPSITVISWCENQTGDKNLYRGIKEVNRNALIIGCQCYIAYPPYINQRIAELEKQRFATPDCLLMNGPAYLDLSPNMKRRLGVSFRNSYIFALPVRVDDRNKCAIFLSYHQQLNVEIVELCAQTRFLRVQEIAITCHPALAGNKYLPPLPELWYYAPQPRSELLTATGLVITSESSSAVEAAALGISVIIIASQSTFTCNPMLELGKGEIWELVFNTVELEAACHQLLEYRASQAMRIRELAACYRSECFVEPTAENIALAFQLLPGLT